MGDLPAESTEASVLYTGSHARRRAARRLPLAVSAASLAAKVYRSLLNSNSLSGLMAEMGARAAVDLACWTSRDSGGKSLSTRI